MNNENNNNLNTGQNGHAGQSDRLEIEQFIESLETETRLVDSLSEESRAIARFGADIRESADSDLPTANSKLREMLLEQIQGDISANSAEDSIGETRGELKPTISAKESSKPVSRSWLTPGKMAMAACVLLAASLFILLIPAAERHWGVAMLQSATEQSSAKTGPVLRVEGELPPAINPSPESLKYDSELSGGIGRGGGKSGGKRKTFGAEGFGNGQPKEEESIVAAIAQPFGDGEEIGEYEIVDSSQPDSGFSAVPYAKPTSPADDSAIHNQLRKLADNISSRSTGTVAPLATKLQFSQESVDSIQLSGESKSGLSKSGKVLALLDGPASSESAPAKNGVASLYSYEKRHEGQTRRGGRAANRDLEYFRRHKSGYFHDALGTDSSGEHYEPITENRFLAAKGQQALSTFSIDVDTASYSNMRRFLNNQQRPPRNAIRIEELVNYFNYDYPQPQGDTPFSVNMELASCPWNEKHHLLRVGLKGKEIHREERSPSNLVFLLDVSGSMQSGDKLPLLKKGLAMMIQRLSENDTVSIVTYAGNAGVVLEPTNGANKQEIKQAIERLNAGGSTNGSAGINMAYELAQKHFITGGSNRVILATDGDLNVGVTSNSELVKLIKNKASEGVFLTVLGFGTGNLKDSKLEQMADNGNGMYAYIDNFREAHRVLIEQMSGSLETIAKDVKIQIEFNPGEVVSYRLIGYENRVLAAKDFDNDKKDAGEIGAGHTVTALYELELSGDTAAAMTGTQPLRYQDSGAEASTLPEGKNDNESSFAGEILTLSLRYKKPDENESQKIQFSLKDEPKSFSSASGDFQFAAAVASFGMLLRQSEHRGTTSFDWVEATASGAVGDDESGRRIEFLDLVRKAAMRR